MAHHIHEVTGEKYLCMAGGVALNCVANGRVLREGPFEDVWIQPAAGDAGACLGAAALAHLELTGERPGGPQRHAGFGPSYPADEIARLLEAAGVRHRDFRGREANTYRLAELSVNIIDQCVAQGVPFARDYGGYLANRSFGGAQVSRTFYARGQTGQQLLLGAYSALSRQVKAGTVKLYERREMLDLVVVDGVARGITCRNMVTGEIESYWGDAVILATGGYVNVFYLSTNAMGCSATAVWKAAKKGAYMANPCYTQIHPTCIPQHGEHQSKLTLMSESLRNDGRCWVPKKAEDCEKPAGEIADEDRDYYLERKYPSFGNLAPRDIASRAAKEQCDDDRNGGHEVHAATPSSSFPSQVPRAAIRRA